MRSASERRNAAAVREARAAWLDGRAVYLLRVPERQSGGLSAVVDNIIKLGWLLRSTVVMADSDDAGRDVVYFTFVRPPWERG